MYVEGEHKDGDAVVRNTPVLIGGVDGSGNVQTFLVGTDGSISTTPLATGTQPISAAAPTNSTSTAYETNRIAKATAGTLWGLTGFNSKATAQWIQLHDSATLPADTAVPKVLVYVAGLTSFALDYGLRGRSFTTGIVACNSSTGPTKTIGSADCWFDVQYT